MRGATHSLPQLLHDVVISIHAPHAGRDYWGLLVRQSASLFQSTRPMRGATTSPPILGIAQRFQSTRPMRGATFRQLVPVEDNRISIHAPHAGRDSKSIQNYFTHFCDKRQFLDNFTQNAAF